MCGWQWTPLIYTDRALNWESRLHVLHLWFSCCPTLSVPKNIQNLNPSPSVHTPASVAVIYSGICLRLYAADSINDRSTWLWTHKHTHPFASLKSAYSGINTGISEWEKWFRVTSHISPSAVFCLSPRCQIIFKATSQCWGIKGSVAVSLSDLGSGAVRRGEGADECFPPCAAALWALRWEIDACSSCPFSLSTESSIMFRSTWFDLAVQRCFTSDYNKM